MSAFLDTNILVYAQQEGNKAKIAADLISEGGVVSAQVINELANVLSKKLGKSWDEISLVLDDIENVLQAPAPLTARTSRAAIELARDHSLAFYDALIVASAMEAGCKTLFSEDFQHRRRFGGLTVVNPFR